MDHNERRQQNIILALSGVTGLFGILGIQNFHMHMTSFSLYLTGLALNVNNIYFSYKLLDLIETYLPLKRLDKWAVYLVEFCKLAMAFFFSSIIYYNAILRAISDQKHDPNYFYTVIAFAIPTAAIARIIFELRQARELTLKLRVAQAEAQYNLLETQMQPHFLFNSLNVLSELIHVDPDLATSVTQQLADLYREILTNSKQNFSNLASEISILRKYVQIQKIRFGDRISFRTNVNPGFYDLAVPSLILQTLVENAIKHGLSPRQEGGEIELSVTTDEDGMCKICIANTGEIYHGPKKKNGIGTGLQNTKNRLDLFYGSSHNFQIYSDGKKTYAEFKVTPEKALTMEHV